MKFSAQSNSTFHLTAIKSFSPGKLRTISLSRVCVTFPHKMNRKCNFSTCLFHHEKKKTCGNCNILTKQTSAHGNQTEELCFHLICAMFFCVVSTLLYEQTMQHDCKTFPILFNRVRWQGQRDNRQVCCGDEITGTFVLLFWMFPTRFQLYRVPTCPKNDSNSVQKMHKGRFCKDWYDLIVDGTMKTSGNP